MLKFLDTTLLENSRLTLRSVMIVVTWSLLERETFRFLFRIRFESFSWIICRVWHRIWNCNSIEKLRSKSLIWAQFRITQFSDFYSEFDSTHGWIIWTCLQLRFDWETQIWLPHLSAASSNEIFNSLFRIRCKFFSPIMWHQQSRFNCETTCREITLAAKTWQKKKKKKKIMYTLQTDGNPKNFSLSQTTRAPAETRSGAVITINQLTLHYRASTPLQITWRDIIARRSPSRSPQDPTISLQIDVSSYRAAKRSPRPDNCNCNFQPRAVFRRVAWGNLEDQVSALIIASQPTLFSSCRLKPT